MRILSSSTFREELGLSTQPCALGAHALAIIPGCISLSLSFNSMWGRLRFFTLWNHISSIRHGPQQVAAASTHGAQIHVLIIPADAY